MWSRDQYWPMRGKYEVTWSVWPNERRVLYVLPGHPGAGPAGLAGQGHAVVGLIVPALARGLTNERTVLGHVISIDQWEESNYLVLHLVQLQGRGHGDQHQPQCEVRHHHVVTCVNWIGDFEVYWILGILNQVQVEKFNELVQENGFWCLDISLWWHVSSSDHIIIITSYHNNVSLLMLCDHQ